MTPIRRLVIDVLKPHEPPVLSFTQQVGDVGCAGGVTASLLELDKEVQNVKLTIEGDALDYEMIEAAVEDAGGSIHSVDQVACGEYIVEDAPTPQD